MPVLSVFADLNAKTAVVRVIPPDPETQVQVHARVRHAQVQSQHAILRGIGTPGPEAQVTRPTRLSA